MHELDKQINQKLKTRTKSQIPEKEETGILKGNNPCLINCGECNKKYPKNVMTKKPQNFKF